MTIKQQWTTISSIKWIKVKRINDNKEQIIMVT